MLTILLPFSILIRVRKRSKPKIIINLR